MDMREGAASIKAWWDDDGYEISNFNAGQQP